jgi:hypothetical protein
MAAPPIVETMTRRLNPYALKLSSRIPPFATLHHVGRASGRSYSTPVAAVAAREPISPETVAVPGSPVSIAEERPVLVLIGLPWGDTVDWLRNALAAGECTLTRAGTEYRVDRIRVIDAPEARELLGASARMLARIPTMRKFMVGRLQRAAQA